MLYRNYNGTVRPLEKLLAASETVKITITGAACLHDPAMPSRLSRHFQLGTFTLIFDLQRIVESIE